jgi:hypothetical protein
MLIPTPAYGIRMCNLTPLEYTTMIKYTAILAVITLAACAPSLDDPKYEKTCKVPHFKTLVAEFDLDCDYAAELIENSRKIHAITGTAALYKYDQLMKDVPIRVKDVDTFYLGWSEVCGVTNVTNGMGIELSRDMACLHHEENHVIQMRDNPLNNLTSWAHPGWVDNDYEATGDVFWRIVKGNRANPIRGRLSDFAHEQLVAFGYEWYVAPPYNETPDTF